MSIRDFHGESCLTASLGFARNGASKLDRRAHKDKQERDDADDDDEGTAVDVMVTGFHLIERL